jgi:broad specificity phosphatase PhoE
MKITLVRHGQTIENRDHIVQGQTPGQLSELGMMQAQALAQTLASREFTAIYSSDLTRCVDTARYIRKQASEEPLVLRAELREMAFGAYEGRATASVAWPLLKQNLLGIKITGAESWADLRARVKPLLNELYATHPTESILIVTHGGPIRVIRSLVSNRRVDFFYPPQIPNCSIWELEMYRPLA